MKDIQERLSFMRAFEEAVIRAIGSAIGSSLSKSQDPKEELPALIGDLAVVYSKTGGSAIYRGDVLSKNENISTASIATLDFFKDFSCLLEEIIALFGREHLGKYLETAVRYMSTSGTSSDISDSFSASESFLQLYEQRQIVRALYWFSRYAEYTPYGKNILRLDDKQQKKSSKE